MLLRYCLATLLVAAGVIFGQEPDFVIAPGTRIPLGLINTVSTKSAAEGDRVYLETVFPILSNGRIVIPPGSWVEGTLAEVKRPEHFKGRAELFLRFDSLTLPNGVTRTFRARVGGIDAQSEQEFDKTEGKVRAEGNKAEEASTVAAAAEAGAGAGLIVGAATKHLALGTGIGAVAGAAAGVIGVLLSRGPDAVLTKGSTIEMVTDRPLLFAKNEIDFPVQPGHFSEGAAAQPPAKKNPAWSRWPL